MNFHEQIIKKSDQELLDIYVNSDDYQAEFVKLADQELTKRRIPLEKYRIEKEAKSHSSIELLQQGKKGNELYIALGFLSALLGGLIGIIAGYTYSQSKHNGPSETQFYVYDKPTRDKGRIMMIIGIFALLITMIWKLSWRITNMALNYYWNTILFKWNIYKKLPKT